MPLVETQGLVKRYPGVTALDGLTLALEPGLIGLVGANGAGKSTLIKILLGLLEPTAGSVRVLGLDAAREGTAVRSLVGYLPEHDCLPAESSGTEFVSHMARMSGLPRAAARERTSETLRHVGLYDERYRQIGAYSTGMKQRIKLAQALVHDPKLLLLDEPTNGLDPSGREEMLELVRLTGRVFGISVIVASHLLGEIERVCDHLVAIEGGKLLHSATIGEFTAQTAILAVEVEEGSEALAAHLAGRGLHARAHERRLLIPLGDDGVYDVVRDAVAELGLALVRLEQSRNTLEMLFDPASRAAPAHRLTIGEDARVIAGD
ncbi:MAG TPA: ABC transporter ATP-binding protein [Gemmatimonadaceae bacterium]|nr:ABC transporter ATP-binding protein [Gemmatimonadaceae bacterium]